VNSKGCKLTPCLLLETGTKLGHLVSAAAEASSSTTAISTASVAASTTTAAARVTSASATIVAAVLVSILQVKSNEVSVASSILQRAMVVVDVSSVKCCRGGPSQVFSAKHFFRHASLDGFTVRTDCNHKGYERLPTHWNNRYRQCCRSHGRDSLRLRLRLSLRKTLSLGREGMGRVERV
jgi:hypothetical protein